MHSPAQALVVMGLSILTKCLQRAAQHNTWVITTSPALMNQSAKPEPLSGVPSTKIGCRCVCAMQWGLR